MKNPILLSLLLCVTFVKAQYTQPDGAEILQALKKLNTVGSVLFIAAHPDDENTRLLAYLAREKNLRTGYLSITRGDGGQNLVGKEQGDQLGLIRTHELLQARKIDGAEQFFTRANDFGYSKNPDETFKFWNKDSILGDVVWIIRQFKPDVIISRFPTTGEGGHGHHTASAILAVEAFDAAADANRFNHQLTLTETWQAKRLFWNTFNFGSTNTTSPEQVQVDVGIYNPLLGKSYGEIAAESRTMHKSQGFGSAKTRGKIIEYFKLLKGDSVKTLFENIDQSWNRIPGGAGIEKGILNCIKKYNLQSPEKSIPSLITIYRAIQQLPSENSTTQYWKQQKLKETELLILACSGLWMEAYADHYTSIPGTAVNINAQLVNRRNSDVKINRITFVQSDTAVNLSVKQNELVSFKRTEVLDASTHYTNPYWLNEKHTTGIFEVSKPELIGTPENESPVSVIYHLEINGLSLDIRRPISYKYTDPVKGETYRPFEVLPPATINLSEKVLIFNDLSPRKVQFVIKSNIAKVQGTFEISTTEGWRIQEKDNMFALAEKGDEITIEATAIPDGKISEGKLQVSLKIKDGDSFIRCTNSITRIDHDHIPAQFVLYEAEAKLIYADIKKRGVRIGYIPGAGDEIPTALKQVGYQVTTFSDEMPGVDDLNVYDAIVTGIRAYNTNERLQSNYERLTEYVKNGGNLVVQYNTNNRIGPVIAKISPFPFTISRDRVTDETAEVRLINKDHPALNFPNRISSADFEGWIQERGIYFASERDSAFQPILSMNDPNEKPLDGSLIIAKHGKGNFVYTGLAFFRQLPAGVPGAYRLFANLLSLPQND